MFTRAPRKKLFHKGEKCFRPASFGLAQKINSEIPARFHYSVFFQINNAIFYQVSLRLFISCLPENRLWNYLMNRQFRLQIFFRFLGVVQFNIFILIRLWTAFNFKLFYIDKCGEEKGKRTRQLDFHSPKSCEQVVFVRMFFDFWCVPSINEDMRN